MDATHALAPVEIGEGARHAQHAMIAARRELEPLRRLMEQRAALGVGGRDLFEKLTVRFRIAVDATLGRRELGIARVLPRTRLSHPFRDRGRVLGRRRQRKIRWRHCRHVHMEVDAVEERPRDAGLVIEGAFGRPPAGKRGIVEMAAAAGIHRGDELEARGIGDMMVGAGHGGPPRLDRLAQRFQGLARKFGKLVEEEHAVMGERHLARPRAQAAADERRQGRRMMGIAKGPGAEKLAVAELAGDRVNHRHFEGLARIEGWEDSRQPRREHGLAGPRRPDHEQVVAAGGGDLERALGGLLALDLLEIEMIALGLGDPRLRPGQDLGALEMIDEGEKVGGRQHLDLPGPGRLAALGRRTDQPAATGGGGNRRRQHARDGREGAVETELAKGHIAPHLLSGQHLHGDEEAEGDGQIEMAALLEHIGGGEIDDDALAGQGQAEGPERRAHPFAGFCHRLVGEPHQDERRQPARRLHLDIDVEHLDTLEGNRADARDHRRTPPPLNRGAILRGASATHQGRRDAECLGDDLLGKEPMMSETRAATAAFLFDLDGTLVDSVYQHVLAWHEALEQTGIELSVWRIHRRIGMSGGLFTNALLRETGLEITPALVETLQRLHAEAYLRRATQIRVLPGARELLAHLTKSAVPWAIATSGRMMSARPTLEALGVDLERVPVVTRDQVRYAKPDPDLFLAAAARLGVAIDHAVVVGDSVWDLLAARRARALGVGLLSGGYGQDELERAGAYRVYQDPSDMLAHLDEVGARPR